MAPLTTDDKILIRPLKLATEQSGSKSCGLLSVGGITADGVSSQNFRHGPPEARANRLLGSAKPGHIESSD